MEKTAATMTLDEFIEKTSNGQVFTVEFIKRTDNTLRVMNARRGVSKGVKGVGLSYNPADHNLLTVYDMQKLETGATEKGAFRSINLEQLVALRMSGKRFSWDNAAKTFIEEIAA